MLVTITNIIAGLTAFLLLFFTVFLLFHKKGKRQNNLLLSAFLFSNALYIIDFLIRQYSGLFINTVPGIFHIGFFFGFLFGPLLYLYTRSLVYKEFKFSKEQLLHFIPFLFFFILILFSFHLRSSEAQKEMLLNHTIFPGGLWLIIDLFMNIQILLYMVFSIILLNSYSRRIKEYFSTVEKLNLSWLRIIVFAFLFMWLLDLLTLTLVRIDLYTISLLNWIIFFSVSINFVFASLIIYKSLENPELYNGIEKEEGKKYKKSALTEEEKNVILEHLVNYLENEEVFLKPDLSLSDLSEVLNTNSKYISQVINEKLNKNFFDLINSYRIDYAKKLIKETSTNGKTILEILYESGFNSKSVFNTVFKKITGITPTQYKKSA